MEKKEAMKILKDFYDKSEFSMRIALDTIIPELKESEGGENKRISKEITQFLKQNNGWNREWLVWLEKQGQHPIWKHWKSGIAGNGDGEQIYLIKTGNVYYIASCLSWECDYIELSELDKLMLDKQDEQETLCDRCRKEHPSQSCQDITELGRCAVEHEQKPIDKAEPKFHEGDWIVQGKIGVYKVIEVCESWYEVIDNKDKHYSIGFDKEYMCHLWTIQDAKKGDVLEYKGCIFIFKKTEPSDIVTNIKNPLTVLGYCGINHIGFEKTNGWGDTANCKYHPATKEQRDTFFAKMKEAGYEWDAENKKLKMIEEEYNDEDYGIDGLWHAQRILEETLGKVDGYQSDDGILEHKCAISAVKKLYEQKPVEWSEEDECYMSECISAIATKDGWTFEEKRRTKHWLESLKQRIEIKA